MTNGPMGHDDWELQQPSEEHSLIKLIREDWVTNGRAWTSPGFHTLAVYRFGRWLTTLPWPLRQICNLLYVTLYVAIRNLYGTEIPRTAQIGRRLRISHHNGIVISAGAVIGDDCFIRHNVTIGAGGTRGRERERHPRLGNAIQIGSGAAIAGRVSIGNGVRIGPNAVVTTNVRPGVAVFAPSARVLDFGALPDTQT